MGIGLSGMVSGLDTDSIVKALMSTQRQKSTKIENKITTNEWKIEKWKDLNSKIYSMYTGSLYKMKTQGNYLTKRTASSNEKIVTAKASSIAALGTHKVKVSQTASAQYVTGKEITTKGLAKNSKLSEIGKDADGNGGVAIGTVINIKCGDKSERLEVTEDTTIQDFLDACKNADLNANFDTARNRFYISSKKSGEENKFSITTEKFDTAGLEIKDTLNGILDYSALSDADKKKIDEALEVIRSAETADVEKVIDTETTQPSGLNKQYSANQLNILSAYNTIQNIAKDSISSKLALNEVKENIKATIESGGTDPSYSDIKYSENDYKELKDEAKATISAKQKQEKFEEIYGEDFKRDGIDTEVDYKYIQTLKKKVAALPTSGQQLTEEENLIWTVYTASSTNPSYQGKSKKEELEAEEIAMNEELTKMEEEGNCYNAEYKAELNRLIELEVEHYYKNSEKAQAEFENLKKQYKTAAPRDKKPENMTEDQTTQWETEMNAWDAKHAVLTEQLVGKDDDGDDQVDLPTSDSLAGKLKTYAGVETVQNANGLEEIGLLDIDGNEVKGDMTVVAATNGKVVVDDVEYTADSNTITVNGLTLDLKMAKEDEEVTITITQDTDAVYNMVKDFVKEYNELLEEMNKAYNADSARDYEPLTDEQKDAMSEKEIEKWENKIKDSLLRRDNTLGSLINSMRSCLSGSVEFEGKSYALSSFGICSTNYSEKGKLHIYGDPDDSAGAMYDDKLRAAIEENPDAVMEVLQTLSENLYNTVSDKMKSTSLSSALTVYNDKKMTKEITSYKKELAELEKRLADMEARYYKQFTAMEKALSQMNSSANSLASMLGTGTQ